MQNGKLEGDEKKRRLDGWMLLGQQQEDDRGMEGLQ